MNPKNQKTLTHFHFSQFSNNRISCIQFKICTRDIPKTLFHFYHSQFISGEIKRGGEFEVLTNDVYVVKAL